MTCEELKAFEILVSDFNKYWIPCVWFTNLASQARSEGRIHDDVALRLLMDVVTIAVYSFFTICLIGRQFLEPKEGYEEDKIDFYIPI
uniref:Bestrophin homolog n=1 Tax=Callorhinchus milii TaxID=7868 RepID=A0A4W3ICG5_CALMI